MNAAGLTFILAGVSAVVGMPFYQSLVTEGHVSQGELDGTRQNLSSVLAILRNTPHEKVEALVAKYDGELTEHLNRFNGVGQQDILTGFKEAQTIAGYVSTVMSKSGIK